MIYVFVTLMCVAASLANLPGILNGNYLSIGVALFCAAAAGFNAGLGLSLRWWDN
jgi:hypothetical protein